MVKLKRRPTGGQLSGTVPVFVTDYIWGIASPLFFFFFFFLFFFSIFLILPLLAVPQPLKN